MVDIVVRVSVAEIDKLARRTGTRPPTELADRVRAMQRAAARRTAAMPDLLVGDPSWCMLLELYLATIERRQVSVSAVCVASCAPPTTALRHLDRIVEQGYAQRTRDPLDRRRVFVKLSDAGARTIAPLVQSASFP